MSGNVHICRNSESNLISFSSITGDFGYQILKNITHRTLKILHPTATKCRWVETIFTEGATSRSEQNVTLGINEIIVYAI